MPRTCAGLPGHGGLQQAYRVLPYRTRGGILLAEHAGAFPCGWSRREGNQEEIVNAFLSEDFLLQSPTARTLYHEFAERMPIFDYHCHLPVAEIAENRRFANLTEIWLRGDHYKWRAMRAYERDGIPIPLGTMNDLRSAAKELNILLDL